MKKLIQSAAVMLLVFAGFNANAQMVTQTVSIMPGYTNQTFYSMQNGVVSSVSNTDWDLGFQLRGFAASILINSKNNVKLYNANKAASEWSTMVAADTTGILGNAAYELMNSDTSWDYGAFNTTNDPSNAFDLGWGVYDFATHIITGDSVYYIKLATGDYKKLQIIDLASGYYNFRFADVDGSNEQTRSLSKATYQGKFFAYYSIQNDVAIDREPLYNAWDLVFQQYLTLTPFVYKVTGVLMNDSVLAAKAYPVDTATAALASVVLQEPINTIGYDWKTFDMNNNLWVISDSTVYFVQDRMGNPWKMIFTGFGGSANGDFIFNQGPAGTSTGITESSSMQTLGLYPNPASGETRLMLNLKTDRNVTLQMIDVSGRCIRTMNLDFQAGIRAIDIDLNGLTPGLYTVVLTSGTERQVSRVVVQ